MKKILNDFWSNSSRKLLMEFSKKFLKKLLMKYLISIPIQIQDEFLKVF